MHLVALIIITLLFFQGNMMILRPGGQTVQAAPTLVPVNGLGMGQQIIVQQPAQSGQPVAAGQVIAGQPQVLAQAGQTVQAGQVMPNVKLITPQVGMFVKKNL